MSTVTVENTAKAPLRVDLQEFDKKTGKPIEVDMGTDRDGNPLKPVLVLIPGLNEGIPAAVWAKAKDKRGVQSRLDRRELIQR